MTVLEMLSEMICPEKLFALVALPELVYLRDVCYTRLPVGRGMVGKFCATVAADVEGGYHV